jgi:hypothetical protein
VHRRRRPAYGAPRDTRADDECGADHADGDHAGVAEPHTHQQPVAHIDRDAHA